MTKLPLKEKASENVEIISAINIICPNIWYLLDWKQHEIATLLFRKTAVKPVFTELYRSLQRRN